MSLESRRLQHSVNGVSFEVAYHVISAAQIRSSVVTPASDDIRHPLQPPAIRASLPPNPTIFENRA
jgi:hypothetical protein